MPRNLYSALGISQKFDLPHKFVTSPVVRTPFIFAAIRLAVATYTLFTLIFTLIWQTIKENEGGSYFSYFTHLNYIGVCAYYFAASTQTIAYSSRWRKSGAGVGYPLQRWPKFLQALHVILQSSVITFPFLVTIVFWSMLASSTTFSSRYLIWSNISVHILNSAFALFEILFSNSPPAPWLTLLFNILFLVGYLGVAYVTHETLGFYVYAFLDPQNQRGKLAAYILGIAIGEVIIFLIVRGIVVLRERWAIRSGRILNVESLRAISGGAFGDDEEWEEVRRPSIQVKTGSEEA